MTSVATYDFIFVVLVYRNTQDLIDFFKDYNIPNSKVIVVNSFYDNLSDDEFRNISQRNDADYISVENKGYGYGNNKGIEYALIHYKFNYLVISNADVKILSFADKNNLIDGAIIAPEIKTLKGKNQNPYLPYDYWLYDNYKYIGFKYFRYLLYGSIALNKLGRIVFRWRRKLSNNNRIFAAHGSFIIISYSALIKLIPIFNEKMFLFGEEEHLAKLAKSRGIPVYFLDKIKILHKEDGSVGLLNRNIRPYVKKSFFYFYEFWHKK